MNRLISKYFFKNKQFRLSSQNYLLRKYEPDIKLCQFQALPLLPIIQYVFRGAVMISGRLVNRWWKKLSSEEKAKIFAKVKKKSKVIIGLSTVTVGLSASFYYNHLEYSDISGRRRFMAVDSKTLNDLLGEDYHDIILEGQNLSPENNPQYRFINKIIERIITKNKYQYPILDRDWKLIIIDDKNIINAACLPTGHVIVFTGLINFVENSDQLGAVIGHEIAHVLLEHGREAISRASIMSVALFAMSVVLWVVVPGDFTAIFSNWLKNKIAEVFLKLPYSRMCESEADILGLELIARACFQIEESQRFWEIMDLFEKKNDSSIPNWLSTHPAHILRAQLLKTHMTMAQKISDECGCLKKSIYIPNVMQQLYKFRIM